MLAVSRELILLRGLQGSGKSTYAEAWVNESPKTRTRINRDSIRITYFNSYWGEGVDEVAVADIENLIGSRILVTGERDVLVDGTNLRPEQVLPWLRLAREHNYTVRFVDMEITLDEAIRRDSLRERQVGEAVIRSYFEKYFIDGSFPAVPVLGDDD